MTKEKRINSISIISDINGQQSRNEVMMENDGDDGEDLYMVYQTDDKRITETGGESTIGNGPNCTDETLIENQGEHCEHRKDVSGEFQDNAQVELVNDKQNIQCVTSTLRIRQDIVNEPHPTDQGDV